MTPDKFYHEQPPLPWQRNLGQNRLYLGLYKRYLWDVCVCRVIIEVGLSNNVNQILQRPTLVAMATKFKTKQGYNSAYRKYRGAACA